MFLICIMIMITTIVVLYTMVCENYCPSKNANIRSDVVLQKIDPNIFIIM